MSYIGTKDYLLEVAKRNIEGSTAYRQFGFNSNIGTTLEDITDSGIAVIDMPLTALAMDVVSSSASDYGSLLTSGTATAGGTSTILYDTTKDFVALGVVAGDLVLNDTQGQFGNIKTVATTSLTMETPLDNGFTWATSDAYRIVDKSAGGVGAQVVEAHGLDGDFNEIEEFIITNGTTKVSTVHNYRRINNFHSIFAGTGITVGNIDISQTATPTKIMDRIGAGGNMSLQAFFTIPLGKTGYITDWGAGSDGSKPIRFILRATANYSDRRNIPDIFHFQDIILSDGAQSNKTFPVPLRCPEKVSIKVSGIVTGSGTGVGGASFGLILVDND